jgi:D-3-phosphoglycerate dehydrogenase
MTPFKVALIAFLGQTVPEWVIEAFAEQGIDFVARECVARDELAHVAGDADVVWVFGSHQDVLTADNLDVLPRCGAIIRTGSGTDNVPVPEATGLGIVVANTPEAVSDSVSNHAIGLLLAVIRHIAVQDRRLRAGLWDQSILRQGWHLRGQTLGLVGFGHIGRLVARKIHGFELTILVHDPYVSADVLESQGVLAASLDEVLSQSNFVSLHCPLTEETYHLIGERELRLMQPSAILINTTRGPVVDEPVLVRALTEGWIAAAGLDVFEQEPADPDNPLFKLDNVVVTSHMAGFSDEILDNFWRMSVETALDLAKGQWPRSYVNHDVKPRWRLT